MSKLKGKTCNLVEGKKILDEQKGEIPVRVKKTN
jgi:hypothetical protein